MDFNARYMPKMRAYEYIITWKKDVFSRRYKTYIPKPVDPEKFKKILSVLTGKHDFNNFRIKDENNRTTIREIYKIDVYFKNESEIGIYIEGSAFLKTQVRIIVGTALDVYFGRKSSDYLELLLNEPEKERKIEVAEPSAFLKTQVRIIVGTALDVYFGRKSSDYLELLLNEPEKERKIEVAEPGGLYLIKVEF